jgi:prolipoprotein diacylglyceryltransferase
VLAAGGLFALHRRTLQPGKIFSVIVLGYAAARIGIDLLRPANPALLLGQAVSLGVVLLALHLLRRRRASIARRSQHRGGVDNRSQRAEVAAN